MSHLDEADELKEIARDFGLRVHDLRAVPQTNRFVVALNDEDEPDRVYVHASLTRLSISLDLVEGESKPLTYEEALETMLEAIGG